MDSQYKYFSSPFQIEKAVNELHGMISGIKADDVVSHSEIEELLHWCSLYAEYKSIHPFNELFPAIEAALEDNILTEEEIQDLLWLCERLAVKNEKYDPRSAMLQTLHGYIHGLLADGVLNDKEIFQLQEWIDDNAYLKGTYPFDEIESLLLKILEDRIISEDERKELFAFLSEFVDTRTSLNLTEKELKEMREHYSVKGVCCACPEIVVPGKLFCVTGESKKCSRAQIEKVIIKNGGSITKSVVRKTDYLIVGANGSECWSYSCYGRKVEKAMDMRKSGAAIIIVHENDFWDLDLDMSDTNTEAAEVVRTVSFPAVSDFC